MTVIGIKEVSESAQHFSISLGLNSLSPVKDIEGITLFIFTQSVKIIVRALNSKGHQNYLFLQSGSNKPSMSHNAFIPVNFVSFTSLFENLFEITSKRARLQLDSFAFKSLIFHFYRLQVQTRISYWLCKWTAFDTRQETHAARDKNSERAVTLSE